ncbi:hypothetical protein BMF94_2487 [Rhodotorula taiwanensis]|uniref:Uncharacterized protein n=1 Tax=Rhodotorula taiwanensis TaxID=741276 RepID=A0A2S5BCK1_9BASI|nr:hypothetical protein BMF94_2487 [Rhodotorula taiwanensis]
MLSRSSSISSSCQGLRRCSSSGIRSLASTSSPRVAKVASPATPSAPSRMPGTRSDTRQADAQEPPADGSSSPNKPKLRSPTDPAADYQRRLEERFGGGEAAALGQLVDGKPEGLAANVKRNMFRLI